MRRNSAPRPRLAGFADWLQQPAVIEPVDPFQRGELDCLETPPRSTPIYDLDLVKPVERFGERIVVGIADAPDRRLEPGVGLALGIFNRHILAAPVAMVDQAAAMVGPAFVQVPLKRIEDKGRLRCPADAPADDPP